MADAFLTRKGGEDVTPEVNEQTVIIQDIMESLVGKVYGANATAETILKGYSAYVHQKLVEGTLEPGIDLLSATGYTKMAVDKITFSTKTTAQNTVLNHSLGTLPTFFLLLAPVELTSANLNCIVSMQGHNVTASSKSATVITVYDSTPIYTKGATYSVEPTDEKLTMKTSTAAFFAASVEYTLITLA